MNKDFKGVSIMIIGEFSYKVIKINQTICGCLV